MLTFLGILSGVLFIIADLPYVRDVLKGTTKPHRASWFLFALINTSNFANQLASGAKNSLWIMAAASITTTLIFILSLKRGVGGFERLDIICISFGLAGLALWFVFKTPTMSILCNLVVATIALIPTVKKAYIYPETETKSAWLIASISDILAAISVGEWNLKLLILPIHGFIMQIMVFMLLVIRSGRTQPKNRVASDKMVPPIEP